MFYQNSGGGMTLSGGDPLMQPDFSLAVLRECRNKGIHTALDTSGYGPWEDLSRLLPFTDLVLYDIKHMDSEAHRSGTGKSNRLILENAARTAGQARIWVRVPVIPGYNDSDDCLGRIGELARDIKAESISLLPYHEWGRGKYPRLGRRYPMDGTSSPTDEQVEHYTQVVEKAGVKANIGR